jgi:hypothetical protein
MAIPPGSLYPSLANTRKKNVVREKSKYRRFEVFATVTVKNAVFWDVAATCSRWFLAPGFLNPEDGGDTLLRNVGIHKIYTAPHPRRRHYSKIKLFC